MENGKNKFMYHSDGITFQGIYGRTVYTSMVSMVSEHGDLSTKSIVDV